MWCKVGPSYGSATFLRVPPHASDVPPFPQTCCTGQRRRLQRHRRRNPVAPRLPRPAIRQRISIMAAFTRRSSALWAVIWLLVLTPSLLRAADAPKAETTAKPQRLLYTCLDKDVA